MESSFRTIICGVDFSQFSKSVVKQALALKKEWNTKLILVHVPAIVTELPISPKDRAAYNVKLKREVYKVYRLSKRDADVVIGRTDRPSDELVRIAKKSSKPLIVAGHVGQSAITRFFLGSTAENLALLAPCPVWIHRDKQIVLPTSILVPTDLHKPSKILRFAQGLSENQKVSLLYISRPVTPVLDQQLWAQLEQALIQKEEKSLNTLKRRWPGVDVHFKSGDPVREILKFAKNYDVVLMAPHDRPRLMPTFGSVTAKVLRQGTFPILVIR